MSKKGTIKKFYRNNRIYCILMMVSFLCILLLGGSVLVYFIHQAAGDSYGVRLEGVKSEEVEKDVNAIKDWYSNKEGIIKSNVRIQGKIVYVEFEVDSSVSNETIQGIATSSLEVISDYTKDTCDIQFIVNRKDMGSYFGSKGRGKTVISWANYNLNQDKAEQ